jgi:hypothetical protein
MCVLCLGKKLTWLKKVTSTGMPVFLMPIHLCIREPRLKTFTDKRKEVTEGKLKEVVRVRERGTDDDIGANPVNLTISTCQNRN